jgi:radical SAM protein with 4Fe4S-binding SPASM domain
MNYKKFSLGIGFTSECNMNCPFCYSKNKRAASNECTYQNWINFFEKNGACINSINYGTGENSISEKWYKLISYIREHFPHIKQALTTNGSLYNLIKSDRTKLEAVKNSIDEIDVSLDWGNEQTHNLNRGNNQAFQWAIETLNYCQKNNFKTTIVTLGTSETLTVSNMSAIFEIARKYNSYVRINLYRPINEIENLTSATLKDIIALFDWIHENHKIVSISEPLLSSIFSSSLKKNDPSGKSSLRITADGNIYPSTYLLYDEFLIGNISNFDLESDILNNEIIRKFISLGIPKDCLNCDVVGRCNGGVLDRRYIWYKDLSERDPYCPKKHGLTTNLRDYKICDEDFSSVHDEYLPTLFFKFKEEK